MRSSVNSHGFPLSLDLHMSQLFCHIKGLAENFYHQVMCCCETKCSKTSQIPAEIWFFPNKIATFESISSQKTQLFADCLSNVGWTYSAPCSWWFTASTCEGMKSFLPVWGTIWKRHGFFSRSIVMLRGAKFSLPGKSQWHLLLAKYNGSLLS